MIHSSSSIRFNVAILDTIESPELENALGLANKTQRAFDFKLCGYFPVDEKYRLANSGLALDEAVRDILKSHNLPRPLIFFTSLAYSQREDSNKEDWFYFAEYAHDDDASVSIVSTYLWNELPGLRRPQPYILFSLAAVALNYCTGLEMHEETWHCPFDYCHEPSDIDHVFSAKELCSQCERYLNAAVRSGQISIVQLAAARRLLNRASNRRIAFIAMPFLPEMNAIYLILREVLESNDWDVLRADQISRPRTITIAIVQAILTSDLVVADLTGSNPNVFYELGWAHAAGCDVVMITQDQKIPIDVITERAVFYDTSNQGLAGLAAELKTLTS